MGRGQGHIVRRRLGRDPFSFTLADPSDLVLQQARRIAAEPGRARDLLCRHRELLSSPAALPPALQIVRHGLRDYLVGDGPESRRPIYESAARQLFLVLGLESRYAHKLVNVGVADTVHILQREATTKTLCGRTAEGKAYRGDYLRAPVCAACSRMLHLADEEARAEAAEGPRFRCLNEQEVETLTETLLSAWLAEEGGEQAEPDPTSFAANVLVPERLTAINDRASFYYREWISTTNHLQPFFARAYDDGKTLPLPSDRELSEAIELAALLDGGRQLNGIDRDSAIFVMRRSSWLSEDLLPQLMAGSWDAAGRLVEEEFEALRRGVSQRERILVSAGSALDQAVQNALERVVVEIRRARAKSSSF